MTTANNLAALARRVLSGGTLPPSAIASLSASLAVITLGPHVRVGEAGKGALIGLLAVILAGCAAPRHNTNWGAISHEVGRTINTR